jgi:hypothetical protein
MLDSNGFAELTKRQPFLWHLIWESDEAKRDSILSNGLCPGGESRYEGHWRSRPGHVYMGSARAVETNGRQSLKHDAPKPWDLLRIDVSQLEPRLIDPDEDHFMTQELKSGVNEIAGKHVCRVFGYPFAPSEWMAEWAAWLKIGPLPSLGEWADQVGLGKRSAETRYSASQGSLSYAGVVPPSALQLVETTVPVCGSA